MISSPNSSAQLPPLLPVHIRELKEGEVALDIVGQEAIVGIRGGGRQHKVEKCTSFLLGELALLVRSSSVDSLGIMI